MDKNKSLFFSVLILLASVLSVLGSDTAYRARIVKLQVPVELPSIEAGDIPSGRISGGQVVSPNEIPYIVGVTNMVEFTTRWCGGSLISMNFVLTAASCFTSDSTSVTVYLGASNMTDITEIVAADQLIIHDEFYPGIYTNDIALVRLFRAVFPTPIIRPVRLPNWRQLGSFFTNQIGAMSGWGAQHVNSPEMFPLNHLRRVYLPVLQNEVCLERFPGLITDNHICTSSDIASPCQGDYGGPLTVSDPDGGTTQIGIFSFLSNYGCNSGWPAVFTRITPYLLWIERNSDVLVSNNFEYCGCEL